MHIYFDIETCPAQDPAVREEIRANIKAPGQYSKPESIAKWMDENADAEAEAIWRKTSFDGTLGHICVIGYAIDDRDPVSVWTRDWHENEAQILYDFYRDIDMHCMAHPNVRPVFVGHNIIEFDLRFLFQRSVVLGVKPSRHIPFHCKPWDSAVFDTWQAWGKSGSLDKIAKALKLGGKGDMDGSKVWDAVKEGRIAEVAQYCKNDVALTRGLHQRMTFAEAA